MVQNPVCSANYDFDGQVKGMNDASQFFHEVPDDDSCISKYNYSLDGDSLCGCSFRDFDVDEEFNDEHEGDYMAASGRDSLGYSGCSLELSYPVSNGDQDNDKEMFDIQVTEAPRSPQSAAETPKPRPGLLTTLPRPGLVSGESLWTSMRSIGVTNKEDGGPSALKQAKKWTSFRVTAKNISLDDCDVDEEPVNDEDNKTVLLPEKLQKQQTMKQWNSFRWGKKNVKGAVSA